MTLTLDPTAIDLATLRQLWQGAAAKLDAASRCTASRLRRVGRADRRRRRDGLWRQHRLRPARQHPHPRRAAGRAPAQPDPVAQRGLGDALPRHVVRLMIVLKLLGLGRGYSGVRPLVIDALQALLDRDAMPLIPSQGSVGASGDLAPLAHLIAALMGEGEIDIAGEILPAARGAREARHGSRSSSAPRKASR